MNNRAALREARQLRLKMQTDSRFHLEVLAALSRTFRENGESVSKDLLRSLVFAVPDELPGRNASAMVNSTGRPAYVKIPPQPGKARGKSKKKSGKKKGAGTSIPPQPGRAGSYRVGIPPQPGAARRKSKKGRKKSAKR
jgi:hypothetical protein